MLKNKHARSASFFALGIYLLMPSLALAEVSYQPYYLIQAPVSASSSDGIQTIPATTAPISNAEPLPTFSYDPKLDPRNVPYVAPSAGAVQEKMRLGTDTGAELGLQLSHYHYQEHIVPDQQFMHLSGDNIGLIFDGSRAYRSGFFWGGDARLTYGRADYTGGDQDIYGNIYPSSRNGDTNIIAETRAFLGHDYIYTNALWGTINFSLSPYAGLGFRYLFHDGSGSDSNGVKGYKRYSHYLYVPFGITPRFRITDASRISLNAEYDQLIYGWQVSAFSDGDLTNSQHGGRGWRGSVMYEREHWSFGPFANYWNINESSYACTASVCGWEPHNQTYEYGLQGKYRF